MSQYREFIKPWMCWPMVEMGKFAGVDFLEVQACPGVRRRTLDGGERHLSQNPAGRGTILPRIRERPQEEDLHRIQRRYRKGLYHLTREINPVRRCS